jgi:DnaJ-class molecular chaperone
MNLYDILEVSPKASEEVIKNAYKALEKKYHPEL